MAGETVITVVGNLTSDPELRYTQNGLAVANFTIASTPRSFDRASNDWKDGDALFLRASVWREFAEHVAALAIGQHNLLAIAGLDEHLDVAVAQDKNLAAGIAIFEKDGAFLEIAAIHASRQIGAFGIVE